MHPGRILNRIERIKFAQYLQAQRFDSAIETEDGPVDIYSRMPAPVAPADEEISGDEVQQLVKEMLHLLTPTQQYVLSRLFGLGQTEKTDQREVAWELGITRGGVFASKESAFRTIRKALQRRGLSPSDLIGE